MNLSIIILNYNTKELTQKAIRSVFMYPPDTTYELIVVDNNSTDNSVKQLKTLQKKYPFTLVENSKNLGFSGGNNVGIKMAKGNEVLLLNSDTKVTKGALTELYDEQKSYPDAGVFGARLLNKDGTVQASVYRIPTIYRAVRQYWFGEKGLLDKYIPRSKSTTEVEAVVGAVFLITKSALKEVGLLNEQYFMYFEDLDYCREVRKKGLKVYYVPSALVYHYHGQSGKSIASDENQWKRLIPSSKTFHGLFGYYAIFFVMKSRQLIDKMRNN